MTSLLLLFSFLFSIPVLAFLAVLILFYGQRKFYKRQLYERYRSLISFHRIYKLILEDLDYEVMIQRIADIIPTELRFATGVLAIVDSKTGMIKRIAASKTEQAKEAIDFINSLSVPFDKIDIKLSDPNNIMARAIREKKPFVTKDVYDVLGPALPREETLRVQKIMGTKTTFAYPIFVQNYPIGVFLASTKKAQNELDEYELEVIDSFVNLIGLALQNAKLFTSLKHASFELGQANEKLKQLDKLKDDFVSVASHELRTPMTAIRSYAWMALNKSDMKLSDKMQKYLIRVLISTERLINLVNDMLNVSRIESGRIEINPTSVDLISLAKDIVDEVYYSKAREKTINFQIFEKPIPKAFADPDKLRQVLLNLVGNSLKFTPNGGKIMFDFFTDGKVVEVAVKDTGVGLSKEDQGRLFQKFGRLDNSYVASATSGGTGLGLFISKNLVELMHGKIWASSEGLGKGTTFTVALPIATAEVLQHAKDFAVKSEGGEAKPLEPVAI